MEFTTACIKVHTFLQQIFEPPILFSFTKQFPHPILTENPKWSKTKYLFAPPKIFWYTTKYLLSFVLIIFSFFRIVWLLSKFKLAPNFEQLGYYVFTFALAVIAKSAYDTVDQNIPEFCYMVTQRFKYASYSQQRTFGTTFIYAFSSTFLTFPVLFAAVPLLRDFDPIQLIMYNIWGLLFSSHCQTAPHPYYKYFAKVLAVTMFSIFGSHVAHVAVIVLQTICVLMLEADIILSKETIRLSNTSGISLFQCVHKFNILRISIILGYWIVNRSFLAVLVGLGVVAGSLCGFVMILMYSKFPFIFYLACSAVCLISMVTNLLLVTLAGIPNYDSKTFTQIWKFKVKRKQEKALLQSCPPIGFAIGFIKEVRFHTALKIFDTFVSCTSTMVLLFLKH